MKKLNEMKLAKQDLLSEMEKSSALGGLYIRWESDLATTEYHGPTNPGSITTYLDGLNMGSDGGAGSMGGDTWDISVWYAAFKIDPSNPDIGTITVSGSGSAGEG